MRVRIAYPAGHQRPAAPVHAFNHGLKPRRADRQRDTSTPPPAAAAGRWLRRDPQLLRNHQGRPVLTCSQRSRQPRRPGSRTPGPAASWRCHLNAGRAGRGRTPAGQMNTPAPRAPAPVRSGQCGQSVGRPLAAGRWPQILPSWPGWLCSLCRLCRQFHFILEIHFPAAFFQAAPAHRTKEIRTKTAGIVRNLVRKIAKVLIISVSCGA